MAFFNQGDDRQLHDVVAVLHRSAKHRVVQFHFEPGRRANAADGAERSAEHHATGGELRLALHVTRNQIRRRTQCRELAVLVKVARAVDGGVGAQLQVIPVRHHVVEPPQLGTDRLGAQLLRQRHALCLGLAVGVIGADGQPQPVIHADDDRLDLAAAVRAQKFNGCALGQQACSPAIEQRYARGRRHTDRGELVDVVLHGGFIARGPSGDHEVAGREAQGLRAGLGVTRELQHRILFDRLLPGYD